MPQSSTSDSLTASTTGNHVDRTAIVVASIHHGNTLKIAEALAVPLDAKVLSLEQATHEELSRYDLVGFGSGIYFGRHDASLRKLVASLDHLPRLAFVFSTAGLPFLSSLFHWPLRRALVRRGCHIVGEFSCRGWDTVGPLFFLGGINRRHPDERDLSRARFFATELKELRSSEMPDLT